nr:hypothetical protein [Tanacetum cinerariifolium]
MDLIITPEPYTHGESTLSCLLDMVPPVPTGKPKVKPVPTGKPKVKPVPTGKPNVTPVPTGRPNRPFLVPTDRGYTPSVMSGWWSHTASPMPHLLNPTSSFFQTYTPYVPTTYYNHMKYSEDRWATPVSPQQVVLGNHIEKELASPEQTTTGKDISNPSMDVMICQKSLGFSNSPLIQVLRVGLVINPPGFLKLILCCWFKFADFSRTLFKTQSSRFKIEDLSRNWKLTYRVLTGRVIVPAGRYIVPTGSVIVTTGRYIVPAGKKDLSEWDTTSGIRAIWETFLRRILFYLRSL